MGAGVTTSLEWREDAGQHIAKLGPFTFIAFRSDDPDRKPGETHVLVILREGRTVAMSEGASTIHVAKSYAPALVRAYVASERKLLAELAGIVG